MSEMPWFPYAAIRYLEAILSLEMHVFEYGSGGSTIFLSKRVAHVVSVEHSAGCYQEIKPQLPANCEYLLIPVELGEVNSDSTDPLAYRSADSLVGDFRAYASVIDDYEPFDLVIVDGRARPSCLWHAHTKVKPGGYLLLDNSDREYYLEKTVHLFKGWERYTFWGMGPLVDHMWEATIWKRVTSQS